VQSPHGNRAADARAELVCNGEPTGRANARSDDGSREAIRAFPSENVTLGTSSKDHLSDIAAPYKNSTKGIFHEPYCCQPIDAAAFAAAVV